MRMRFRRSVIFGIAALALAAPVIATAVFAQAADDDDDHDLARDLHEGGEIRALSEILRKVGEQVPGEIVAVNLVRMGERWVYRVQVVTTDGRRAIVDVDAGKGTVFDDAGRE
jgi:uncharacterized membrane protein YkoI